MMEDYNLKIEDLFSKYNTGYNGISEEQAAIRIKKNGYNEIKLKNKNTLFHMIINQFKDMLVWMLIFSSIITIIIDKNDYMDALLIIIVVIFNATLGVVQEYKARTTIKKISSLSRHNAHVKRDGRIIEIPAREVVIGDLVILDAGNCVPADIIVIKSAELQALESALTGESKSVLKSNNTLTGSKIIAERNNMLFSSTFITSGSGEGIVVSIGNNTEIGKIAKNINDTSSKKSPLEEAIKHISKLIGVIIMGICIVIYALELFTSRNVLESFKTAVSLSVAAIPEGLSTVITMVMALSVLKLSKNNAIVKRMPSAEALGAISVIATDKTGTITTGNLTLNSIIGFGRTDGEAKEAFRLASLSPTNEINRILLESKTNSYFKAIPFSSSRKLETIIYKDGNKYVSYTKGAFDVMFKLAINKNQIFLNKAKSAATNYRVLFVAKKEGSLDEVSKERDFKIIGMALFEDEIRSTAMPAILECRELGVKPIMITGDFKDTAFKIAKEVKIASKIEEVATPEIIHNLSDEELRESLDKYSVYSRVEPLDKLRIIKAYQNRKDVIAMTGDGINDSPALKNADIGVAMGNGSDIAKDAADMILLDNSFRTIVLAIKDGRRSYLNIQKTIRYLLSSNIGEVALVLFVTIVCMVNRSFGPALKPVHLLWINLVTDTLPAIAIGLDNTTMISNRPRKKDERIISKKMMLRILFEGIVMGLMAFISFRIGRSKGLAYGQTMAFVSISMSQLFFSLALHGFKKFTSNNILNIAFILGTALTLGACYILGPVFKFASLSIIDLIIAILLALPLPIINSMLK